MGNFYCSRLWESPMLQALENNELFRNFLLVKSVLFVRRVMTLLVLVYTAILF